MGKSFTELSNMLREFIKDLNSDAHNAKNFHEERYNNIKMTMDPQSDPQPHVIITIAVSEAKYSITNLQRITGSLGPDEKYVGRWFNRMGIIDTLKDIWREVSQKDKESVDSSDIEDIEEIKKMKGK